MSRLGLELDRPIWLWIEPTERKLCRAYCGRSNDDYQHLPADTTDFGSLSRFRNSLHRIDFTSFLTVD